MPNVTEYIADRIRRPAPEDCYVIPGSTPVVGFGNWRKARIATVGLNPGPKTFLPKPKVATHESLNVSSLIGASDDVVSVVLSECDNFFGRKQDGPWFKKLEKVLLACGASYHDGTACHLDIVQWATNPAWRAAWRKMSGPAKKRLVTDDTEFLRCQLKHSESIKTTLLNGTTVMKHFPCELSETDPPTGDMSVDIRLFAGQLFNRIQVIGWNINLQSQPGVTNTDRAALAARVGELVKRK